MKFGAVPVDQAIGTILAHGIPAASLIKIISYAVTPHALTQACDVIRADGVAEGGGALNIRTAQLKTATLIETHHPGGKISAGCCDTNRRRNHPVRNAG